MTNSVVYNNTSLASYDKATTLSLKLNNRLVISFFMHKIRYLFTCTACRVLVYVMSITCREDETL